MDYVETVLRRQSALWGLLLEGRTEPQEQQAQREERRTALEVQEQRELNWETPEWSMAADSLFAQETGEKARRAGGTDLFAPERRRGENAEREPQRLSEADGLPQALEQRSRAVQLLAMEEGQAAAAAPSGQETLFKGRVASHAPEESLMRSQERREESVRPEDNGVDSFSLLLERDSRRYNSGFSLY